MSLQGSTNQETLNNLRNAVVHGLGAASVTIGTGWLVVATDAVGRVVGAVAIGRPDLAIHEAYMAAGSWVPMMLAAGGVAWEALWLAPEVLRVFRPTPKVLHLSRRTDPNGTRDD